MNSTIAACAVSVFVLGICLHLVLYEPTAMLPAIWRNLARYVLGVAAVLSVEAFALLLLPRLTAWQAFLIQIMLFALCGLGVAVGYLINDD